jgi:hypothetical protein
MYDATQRPQAHQLETYSSKCGTFSPTLLAPHPHASGEGEAFRGWPRWSSNAGSSRLGTSLHSVWGRIVPDIPDFCRELVAALADGQAPGRRSESRPVAVSKEELGEDLPECIRLFYVRGVPAVGEDLLAVATAACRVFAEGYLKAALAKDRS